MDRVDQHTGSLRVQEDARRGTSSGSGRDHDSEAAAGRDEFLRRRPRDTVLSGDSFEIIKYDTRGIPLYIQKQRSSEYTDMRSTPHRHEDIELMYVVSGLLDYRVNGHTVRMGSDDCTIVNSRYMHYSAAAGGGDAEFISITMHPSLFTGSQALYDRYVDRVLRDPSFVFRYYDNKDPFHPVITGFVKELSEIKSAAGAGYEMKVVGLLHSFWIDFADYNGFLEDACRDDDHSSQRIYRDMVAYIHQHYMEKITLEDIAAAGKVCRSKCCEVFRRRQSRSPVEFLNEYRLEMSRTLLDDAAFNITDVAFYCGFSSSSYFSTHFKKRYGISPREYRKRYGCFTDDKGEREGLSQRSIS